ncbi:hypothetical protein ACFPK9_12235 [Rubritalea spongiae]|uniref:HEAT repeat domain-containing protein n=1 Tax=Rubritalea spongiae TaxID=430797 RepID=A0ABW5E000_9BACT
MNAKWTLPIAGAWLVTVASAYYIGSSSSNATSSSSADTSADNQSGFQRSSSTITGANSGSSNGARTNFSARSSLSGSSKGSANILDISKISDPLERSRKMLDFIEGLSAEEFEGALADLRASGMGRERRNEFAMLLRQWGKVDPIAALAYTTSQDNEDRGGRRGGGDFASQEVLAAWASTNPNAALNWARENHEGEDANPFLVGVIKGLASTDSALATQLLQELPYSEERGEALRDLIPYVAQMGPEGASQWLNSLGDERLITGAADRMAEQFARQDPSSAAQWALTLEQGDARTRAIDEVMENWSRNNIAEATAWMQTLSPEDQLSAGPEYVENLSRQDPVAAADWVDSQVNAPNYQNLLKEFAEGASRTDPVLALNYGNEIENQGDRTRTVGRALWSLYRQDKESARAWINSNQVPEGLSSHVERMFKE